MRYHLSFLVLPCPWLLQVATVVTSSGPLFCCLFLQAANVAASSGTPFSGRHRVLGSARSLHASSSRHPSLPTLPPLNPRAQRYLDNLKLEHENERTSVTRFPTRGGQDADGFVKVVGTATSVLVQCGKMVLPPAVALVKVVANVYRALPKDVITQIYALCLCFAGGYYPTLFSSLTAAQHCGWNVMVGAIQDLTDEALRVIHALDEVQTSKFGFDEDGSQHGKNMKAFRQQTSVVLATMDPMKINQAAGALYTTWLGVSSVLEKEYARVITLSLTLANFIERIATFLFAPAARLCISKDYHQWVPFVIGWGCKAAAMNIAWRIQRIMSAGTSAIAGGIMFARATARILHKRGIRLFGLIRENEEETFFDEIVGWMVAGLGFYTQFEAQYQNGFSFNVPFPLSLVTWPLDWAERWIQWQITKESK